MELELARNVGDVSTINRTHFSRKQARAPINNILYFTIDKYLGIELI